MLSPMSRNTSILQPFATQSWDKSVCWSLLQAGPFLLVLYVLLVCGGPQLAASTANGWARLPGRISAGFEVVQIETAAISSQFPFSSWKAPRSLKRPGSTSPSTAPSQNHLTAAPAASPRRCLTAAPAQLHQHAGSRVCRLVTVPKHNWPLPH